MKWEIIFGSCDISVQVILVGGKLPSIWWYRDPSFLNLVPLQPPRESGEGAREKGKAHPLLSHRDLELTHITSIYIPWERTSHMTPHGDRRGWKRMPSNTGRAERQWDWHGANGTLVSHAQAECVRVTLMSTCSIEHGLNTRCDPKKGCLSWSSHCHLLAKFPSKTSLSLCLPH